MTAPEDASAFGRLPDADRTGRIGVMYVRALCAQAGYGTNETSPGEDHNAIDLSVTFPGGDIRVQVKAGTMKPRQSDGSLRVTASDAWLSRWRRNRLPAYLVYVRLPSNDFPSLVTHHSDATRFQLHAYWTRVDQIKASPVVIPATNRLTIDSFATWQNDITTDYGVAS